jgi:hypothetical protein
VWRARPFPSVGVFAMLDQSPQFPVGLKAMPLAFHGSREGLLLSLGLLALAAFFAVRQRAEKLARADDLSGEDARYFARKDKRRYSNSAVMGLIAVGIAAGTLIDPRESHVHRRVFAGIWLAVLSLVLVLVAMAIVDAFATYAYAVRHRQALADERLVLDYEIKREAARLRNDDASSN